MTYTIDELAELAQLPLNVYLRKLYDDFTFFTEQIWIDRNLRKFAPIGEIESDMLWYFQHGPKRQGILANRGFGKTHLITAAGTCWDLYRDPDAKILIVSKSQTEAKKTVRLIRDWVDLCPFLAHLSPDQRSKARRAARDTTDYFDVAPAKEDRTPSVVAKGIEGQITGTRASRVLADDVETEENTKTPEAREELFKRLGELTDICTYGDRRINYVGTFHHEQSVYPKLHNQRQFHFRAWPLVYPSPTEQTLGLAPILQERLDDGTAQPGEIVAPYRFDSEYVSERMAEGATRFAMQHKLVTNLGDTNRYPLKLRDLICFPLDRNQAPLSIIWGTNNGQGQSTRIDDIPCLGFDRDALYGPILFDGKWSPYQLTYCELDLSGRGKDRTAWSIVSLLNGMLYLRQCIGVDGGYSDPVLHQFCMDCRLHQVNTIFIEDNFGLGMAAPLIEPKLQTYFLQPGQDPDLKHGWNCTIHTYSNRVQKEVRIIDTLEPIIQQHRLVVNTEILRREAFQLQFSRITRERNSLPSDDEIDTVAGACSHFSDMLRVNTDRAADQSRQIERDKEIRQHLQECGFDAPEPRWFTHH